MIKAFPRPISQVDGVATEVAQDGMLLRDYFAAKALQGLLDVGLLRVEDYKAIAQNSYVIADLMLEERLKWKLLNHTTHQKC